MSHSRFLPKLIIILAILAILLVAFLLPNGLRAALANNLWSLKFLQGYQDPSSQLPVPPQTHTHAGLLLARRSLNQVDPDSALAYLLPQVNAADPYALDTYAEVLYLKGELEQACQIWADLGREQTLEQVLRQSQSNQDPQAYFHAARGLYHLNPEKFTPNLAAAYRNLSQNDQALALLNHSIQTYPASKDQSLWYRYLGDTYSQSQQYTEAESAYQQGLTKEPVDTKIYRNLGLLYRGQLNEPAKALECFLQMIELSPKDPYPYILSAQTYEALAQPDQALSLYQAILSFDSTNAEALKNIARLSNP